MKDLFVVLVFLFGFFIQKNTAQSEVFDGTYLSLNPLEYIQISKGKFKIIIPPAARNALDLNDSDSVIASGTVKKDTSSFLILQTENENNFVNKSKLVVETYNANFSGDSLKIEFHFNLKSKYRIDVQNSNSSVFSTEKDVVVIPKEKNINASLHIKIYKTHLKGDDINNGYVGRIAFDCLKGYRLRNKSSNYLLIKIPDLTDSYYSHYLIEREYIKANSKELLWRDRSFYKVSNELITPGLPQDGCVNYENPDNEIEEIYPPPVKPN